MFAITVYVCVCSWCGPCKMLIPRLETLVSGKDGEVLLAKIDIDEHTDLAMSYDVMRSFLILTEDFARSSSSSSHGILFMSVAVSTTDRQVSRLVAFFHADETRGQYSMASNPPQLPGMAGSSFRSLPVWGRLVTGSLHFSSFIAIPSPEKDMVWWC